MAPTVRLIYRNKRIEITQFFISDVGYYFCGYVGVSKKSPLYNKHHEDNHILSKPLIELININREITFSGRRIKNKKKPGHWFFGLDFKPFSNVWDNKKHFDICYNECIV